MNKRLETYRKHLIATFRDGFPNATAYQKREARPFKVFFEKQRDGLTKVLMYVPVWTTAGLYTVEKKHSVVDTRTGHIYLGGKLKGNLAAKQGYQHITWNRI